MSYPLQDAISELHIPGLSSTGHRVLQYLGKRANNKTFECFPAIDTIAKAIGKSRRTVQAALLKLVEFGVIERIYRTGTSSLYRLIFWLKSCTQPTQVLAPQPTQVFAHESVSINQSLIKNKQKPVCVNDLNIEDQVLALNENETASPAVACESTTILADIKSTEPKAIEAPQESLTRQEYLKLFGWTKGDSWKIKRAWKGVSEAELPLIKPALLEYIKETVWKSSGTQGKTYRCNPARWLNEKRWTEIKPKAAPMPQPKPQPIAISKVLSDKDLEHLKKAKDYLDANYEQVKQHFVDICPNYQKNYFDYADKITSDKWLIDFVILNEHRYKLMGETR